MTEALQRQLIEHEGLRLFPYSDTVGKVTIGIGHNLTDRGLTRDQCLDIFRADVATAIGELVTALPWFEQLDSTRQAVLIDMAFNLGTTRLMKFRQTLGSVRACRYEEAAVHMLKSQWAEQVGRRALTLASMMETGINPFEEKT